MIARPATEVIPDLAGDPGRILALVGGGGKTTLLHALGRHHGNRAVLTTPPGWVLTSTVMHR